MLFQFSSVQSLSRVWLFAIPGTAARQASLSITNTRSSLKLMSIESVMPSSHLIPCRPLLLLPPIPPSIRVFSNESTLLMMWPKYWSFSVSIILSKEHPGLSSFRMDCLDLLAVQGTLKSLLQHHNSKASILRHSAFFTVELSHPYMTTGKTIALTRRTFVGKVMSLLLNMLSRLVITFLRSNLNCPFFLQNSKLQPCLFLDSMLLENDIGSFTLPPASSHSCFFLSFTSWPNCLWHLKPLLSARKLGSLPHRMLQTLSVFVSFLFVSFLFVSFYFISAMLKYFWHKPLCKFKMCNTTCWFDIF